MDQRLDTLIDRLDGITRQVDDITDQLRHIERRASTKVHSRRIAQKTARRTARLIREEAQRTLTEQQYNSYRAEWFQYNYIKATMDPTHLSPKILALPLSFDDWKASREPKC